jgi:hypothetical protein
VLPTPQAPLPLLRRKKGAPTLSFLFSSSLTITFRSRFYKGRGRWMRPRERSKASRPIEEREENEESGSRTWCCPNALRAQKLEAQAPEASTGHPAAHDPSPPARLDLGEPELIRCGKCTLRVTSLALPSLLTSPVPTSSRASQGVAGMGALSRLALLAAIGAASAQEPSRPNILMLVIGACSGLGKTGGESAGKY